MAPAQSPAVSVVIPVYGGENFIERTLDSLSAQTFEDFEVLCVDDHSPDRSAEIIKTTAIADPRIHYLKTGENLGTVPKVINSARQDVRGRYFAYSSQDDYFSPDWLGKMVGAIERSDADAVVPNLEFVAADGATLRKLSGWDRYGEATISGRDAFTLSLDWTIPANALWKCDFLREYGYSDFGLYADEYTARCFFLKCRRVGFCDGTFYYAQGNPDAITKRVSAGRLDYPYNQFRVWELTHQHAPEKAPAFAKSVVRDLFEALVLTSEHPELAGERGRLTDAFEGMRKAEFRSDLGRAFGPNQHLQKAAAFALLDSVAVQAFATRAASFSRRLRRKS